MPLSQEFAASFGRLVGNHLWQSTGFAVVSVLVALALRVNHARTRYWLWLAASVKFLVPFSVLAAIGSGLGRWFVPATPVMRLPSVVEQIVQPFAPIQDVALPSPVSGPATANPLPALLLALWLCGFAAVLIYGWVRWRRVAAPIRSSSRLTEGREMEALRKVAQAIRLPAAIRLISSNAKLEPGVFGILRPVLWLPAGIGARLEDAELEAIMAHELCHIRRRDNLLSAIHMMVEALFWFHPLVWWLGARLEEERERACDEEVVRMGGEPRIYAESILKVCEFYLASPVACAAGITGGELKKRIEGIMTNHALRNLGLGQRLLLATAALAALIAPIAVGVMSAPPSPAQSRGAVDAPLHFEVASVRPAGLKPPYTPIMAAGEIEGGPGTGDPTRMTFTWVITPRLLMTAFGVPLDQISGSGWVMGRDVRFDISAKVPPGATKEQANEMLLNLLKERFHLTYHTEKKVFDAYALVVAKGGPKLKKAATADGPPPEAPQPDTFNKAAPLDRDSFPQLPAGRSDFQGTTDENGVVHWAFRMETPQQLAGMLQFRLRGSRVADKTGLTGPYDFTLEFSRAGLPGPGGMALPAPPPDEAAAAPDLFAALEKQLGLKLEKSKAQFDVIVIDHMDKQPTEN